MCVCVYKRVFIDAVQQNTNQSGGYLFVSLVLTHTNMFIHNSTLPPPLVHDRHETDTQTQIEHYKYETQNLIINIIHNSEQTNSD